MSSVHMAVVIWRQVALFIRNRPVHDDHSEGNYVQEGAFFKHLSGNAGMPSRVLRTHAILADHKSYARIPKSRRT